MIKKWVKMHNSCGICCANCDERHTCDINCFDIDGFACSSCEHDKEEEGDYN